MKVKTQTRTLLYVTNTDSNDISVVDNSERVELKKIPVGESPRGAVKFDPRAKFGYVSNCAGNTISVIDLDANKEVAKIEVGLAPRGIALSIDGNVAYVSNSGSNDLSVVDLINRKEIDRIAMGGNPRHMALFNDNLLLVSEWGSDSIAVIDISNNKTLLSNKTIPLAKDSRPYSLNIAKKLKMGLVANTQSDDLSIIDLSTLTETDRVKVGFGGRAVAIAEDEKFAYVTVENTNEIVVVDLTTKEAVHRIDVGPSPRGIAIDFNRNEIYLSNFTRSTPKVGSRNSISIVDITNPLEAKFSGEVIVGLGPCSVSLLTKIN